MFASDASQISSMAQVMQEKTLRYTAKESCDSSVITLDNAGERRNCAQARSTPSERRQPQRQLPMNATVKIHSQRASAIASTDASAIEPSNLTMLTALASEIARRYGQMSDKSCASHSNCDPETTEDGDAMCAIAYAVEHMVQLRVTSIEELGLKARVVNMVIGSICPIDGEDGYRPCWQNLMYSMAQDAGRLFGRKALAA
jgi:hypothetical protein